MELGDTATGRGRVKFWRGEKGWGGVEGDDLPGDVWVHFSHVEMEGYTVLTPGQPVEVRYQRADQDSWRYVALSVRPLPWTPPT